LKKILIVDESDLYRDFLLQRFRSFGMEPSCVKNGFDAIMKLHQETWDLIITEFYLSRNTCFDVLEKKNQDPNLKNTPVIIISTKIERDDLIKLSKLGVKKFFTKPIKVDALVQTVSELLHVKIELDNTPCIIEANINEDLFFIEIALGLNPDKIELLKYRLRELMEVYNVPRTKVLVIMSGLDISSNDSLSLASLLSVIQEITKVKPANLKILTNNDFVKKFLSSRESYKAIELVDNLENAIDSFGAIKVLGDTEDTAQTVLHGLTKKLGQNKPGEINMRFSSEETVEEKYYDLATLDRKPNIAVIDDDMVIREICKKTFLDEGLSIKAFSDGLEFMQNPEISDLDLIFLDLMMPQLDGFQVLQKLRDSNIQIPVIILSALSKKETIIKAMKLGVKSYLIKPVKPAELQKKAIEILRMNF